MMRFLTVMRCQLFGHEDVRVVYGSGLKCLYCGSPAPAWARAHEPPTAMESLRVMVASLVESWGLIADSIRSTLEPAIATLPDVFVALDYGISPPIAKRRWLHRWRP